MTYRVTQVQTVAWLDQQCIELKLTGAVGSQVEQAFSYLLTPEQARALAGALTDYARLLELQRERQ